MSLFLNKIVFSLPLSLVLVFLSCKDNGTNPPSAVEFEITDVEVTPNPVISEK